MNTLTWKLPGVDEAPKGLLDDEMERANLNYHQEGMASSWKNFVAFESLDDFSSNSEKEAQKN